MLFTPQDMSESEIMANARDAEKEINEPRVRFNVRRLMQAPNQHVGMNR